VPPSSVGISHSTSSSEFPKSTSAGTITPTVISPSGSSYNPSLGIQSPSSGGVPSVVVKPATPSPKLHPAVSPSSGGGVAGSGVKMALLVKNRLEEPPADPVTCPINPGKETTIEINKDKMGLGLSIVGGSDTLLVSLDKRING